LKKNTLLTNLIQSWTVAAHKQIIKRIYVSSLCCDNTTEWERV